MKLEDLTTINQLTDFLSGTQAVAFSVISDKDACYRWIQGELVKFRYLRLSRQGKGAVIRYLMKISGYSRQQLTRLIAQYRKTGQLQRRQRTVSGFKQKYTEKDSLALTRDAGNALFVRDPTQWLLCTTTLVASIVTGNRADGIPLYHIPSWSD